MFHIVLYQPEIPPNTGNIIRLCANSGASLHLIHPLAFKLHDKNLRRAGLDYSDLVKVSEYDSLQHFVDRVKPNHLYACSTKGSTRYTAVEYQANDAFLFGPETRGLPSALLKQFDDRDILRIPMLPSNRSLNLSNAVAITLYEAWRQQDFHGSRI